MEYKFEKSSEDDCVVQQLPRQEVIITTDKRFNAGSFKLVALSNNIHFVKEKDANGIQGKSIPLAGVSYDDQRDGKQVAMISKQLQYPANDANVASGFAKSAPGSTFIAKYWAIEESFEEANANFKRDSQEVTIKLGSDSSVSISVPIVVNTRVVTKGDTIVVLKRAVDKELPSSAKRQKVDRDEPAPTGKNQENVKGKAKGKGKGKCKKL